MLNYIKMYKMLIYVVALISFCETYKILLVFPLHFRSQHTLGASMINLLLNAGHEVSYITPVPVTNSHPNLRQIVINLFTFRGATLTTLDEKPRLYKDIFETALNISYATLTDKNVRSIIEDTAQTFDLVIATWGYNDLYSGLSALFNCPLIWFFSFHDDHEILRLIHEAPNPMLTSNLRTNNVPGLSFMQRVEELLFAVTSKFWNYFHYDPRETKAYLELFGPLSTKREITLPQYETVRYNASLVLVNSQPMIRDLPVMPQNYKLVGGFHITETTEVRDPLNQELSNIIESSCNGVILFSLGSFLKAEDLPIAIKRDLLTMFSKLNYTILWKIDEQFNDLPSNVKTFSWMPIQHILAHPKCILFITHGGILSLTESVYYVVPIVGIPVFGDQAVNMKNVVKRGVARMVRMNRNLALALKEAIDDVLKDPRYKENMKTLSLLHHDRLLSPGSELVYWVEYVVATRGAFHLRSPAVLLSWYQKYYVDLAIMLLLFLISLVLIVKKLFMCICHRKIKLM